MRLTPTTFWALSLPEWRAALSGRVSRTARPLARARMEQLMQLYPDSSHV